ncbi:lytic transglycosylase domain-containing protein [Alcanivorax sp. 1008]|uniref:lytic transglycosylase domain-containing protein n=1 Tax=Alcanivorax sp. 1008 TaxID=2816853 RepID=UPI001E39820B|nr:lytic transglycosylase domain-containing protein [Alcanivorax sp. 1008]
MRHLILLTTLLCSMASADTIYQYRQPGGGVLFTDQATDRVSRDHVLLSVRKGWEEKLGPLTAEKRDRYDGDIEYAAQRFALEPALIKAVIHAESHFNPHAVSRVGAQGLMQLMPETAAFLRVDDPFNARQNILGGSKFLHYLTGKFDSLDLVLAAYNAGEGNVRRHGGIPPFKETQGYVKKINSLLPRYRQQFASHYAEEDAIASR